VSRSERGGPERAPLALAVFVSGGGRSLENLAERIAAGALPCRIALVISSRADAGALERAERLGLEALVLDPRRELTPEEFSARAFAAAEERGVELVVLAGFLRLLRIPERWHGRVLNIHPALLPAFGGAGSYGDRVHRAVLARGSWFTGCTVHYATDEYDAGPILVQRVVRVLPGDTVESLAARVFEEEKVALPEAILRHLARGPGSGAPRPPAPESDVGVPDRPAGLVEPGPSSARGDPKR
jgi:phosphoribosylglycinamide formyltransferase-1